MYCQRRRGAAPAHFHLSFTPVSLWEHHSAGRRLALVEYARRHGAWIVEDDYDSEFRHSGEPIPAMLGMVPDAPVVYLGTFSKTLFPALRIGFMVMPPALADAAQDAIGALLRGGHRAEQRALASFIEKGHYARHLAAMRRLYRKRQQQLREALAQEITVPCDVLGGGGGDAPDGGDGGR